MSEPSPAFKSYFGIPADDDELVPFNNGGTALPKLHTAAVRPAFNFLEPEDPEEPLAEKIYDPVEITRYDRRLQDFRTAKDKHDALAALTSPDQTQRLQIMLAKHEVEKAEKAFSAETARGKTEQGRAQDRIDSYRKTPEGKAQRNAGLRKVRDKPNEDLSGLSPAESAQRKRVQDAHHQSEYRKRQKAQPAPVKTPEQLAADRESARLKKAVQRAKAKGTPLDQKYVEALIAGYSAKIAAFDAVIAKMSDLSKTLPIYNDAIGKRQTLVNARDILSMSLMMNDPELVKDFL